jgi:ATPase family associated with various cellular activities (AAA)
VFGWHSEHINDPSLVHPWETSQILLFLLGYRTVVDEHLATGSLNAAGLSIREPRSVRAGHGISGRARPSPEQMTVRWSELIDEREPVSSPSGDDGPDLAILAAIGRDFVRDHANGKAANYSMVLYGPPGTGKTGIAEELADTLDWPLITITVSDFLAEGGLQIEARAKGVFAVLTAQKNTVIIFDEIDHLLLNRNSEQYADVDSSIQLMVPGMLTKIKDLRSAERSIFIIATNYAERIDSAITRPGRIDRKYLVMPPDWGRRKAIVEGLLKGYSEKTREIPGEIITRVTNSPELLKGTARMSYGEIRAVLYDLLSTRLTGDELVNRVRAFTYPDPVADLESYESRKPKTRELKQEELALRVIDREARKQGAEPRATSTRRPSAPPRRSRRPSRKDGGVK